MSELSRSPAAGRLVLVGTPIGNLSDLSPRAAAALADCDFIAAEDTRVTRKLLTHLGLHKPLVSYYEHNRRDKGREICDRLLAGETAALVSDAGMPAISDPGEDLVALCRDSGVAVCVVPGPSAVVTAVALSGLPAGRFCFEGFLSVNRRSRREHLAALAAEPRTIVLYEAPHKLPYTLADLYAALGERRIALCRELTKLYEEVIVTTLSAAAERYRSVTPKGEFVLVIEGQAPAAPEPVSEADAAALAAAYLAEGLSASEAAKRAAGETGVKKGDIYRLLCSRN